MPKLGREFLTSYKGTAFPFREDAAGIAYTEEDVAYGTRGKMPVTAIVDAVLHTPCTVINMYLSQIIPADGAYTFILEHDNPAATLHMQLDNLPALRGGYGTAALSSGEYTVRLVVSRTFNEYLHNMDAVTVYSDTLPFETAVVETRLPRVQSLQLRPLEEGGAPVACPDTDLRLISGYNVRTAVETDNAPDTVSITLSAVPGAGEGIVPCKDQDSVETFAPRLMDLTPDAVGSVRITGDACYEAVPLPSEGMIRLEGACYACCSCDDYVAVGRAIEKLMARVHALHLYLKQLHTRYNDLKDKISEYIYLQYNLKFLSYANAALGGADGGGKPVYGTGSFSIKNHGLESALNLVVELSTFACDFDKLIYGSSVSAPGSHSKQKLVRTEQRRWELTLPQGGSVNWTFTAHVHESGIDHAILYNVSWNMYGNDYTRQGSIPFQYRDYST